TRALARAHAGNRAARCLRSVLDCSKVDAMTAAALFAPAPEGLLEAYEISPAVNHTGNDGPNLIEPAASQQPPVPPPANSGASAPARRAGKKDARQQSLF